MKPIASKRRARCVSGKVLPLLVVMAAGVEGAALEEVVVSAQRVTGDLQTTPISLAVFGADDLHALGVIEPGEVGAWSPNVQIDKTPLTRSAYSLNIRGVGSAEPSLAVDPTVGIYLDGVYMGRQSGAAFEVVDLERIEILRGPQGTLYGRNTTGGAVNIVTTRPSGEWGLVQKLSAGSRGLLRSQTAIDFPAIAGPAGGDLSARLSLNHGRHDGTVRSLYSGDRLGGYDATSGRLSLRWTPGADTVVDYSYDRYEEDSNTSINQISGMRDLQTLLGGDFYAQLAASADADRRSHLPYRNSDKDQPFSMQGHALHLEQDLGWATFKSITSYREWDREATLATFGAFPVAAGSVLDGATGSFLPAGTFADNFVSTPATLTEHEQWSQEFQLLGSLFDERLDYTVGAYWFREQGDEVDPQRFVLPALVAFGELPEAVQGFLCPGGCFGKSVQLDAPNFAYRTDNEAWALYGQFTWAFTDRLDASLGLRFTRDDKETRLSNDFGDVGLATLTESDDWTKVSPTLIVNYAMGKDINAYLSVAEGYRAGGYNIRAANASAFREPFDEETVLSWELGLKSEWLQRRLRVNAALFRYDYDDKQVQQFEAGSGGASSRVVNAGNATGQGLELDITASLSESLTVIASYGYLDFEYDSFVTGLVDVETGFPVFDAMGDAVVTDISAFAADNVNSPRNSGALRLQYALPATDLGRWRLELASSYTGARSFHEQLNRIDSADSYWLHNARLSLEDIPLPAGELELSLWGRNLGNEEVRDFGIDFGVLGYAINNYRELRSAGIDLLYRY